MTRPRRYRFEGDAAGRIGLTVPVASPTDHRTVCLDTADMLVAHVERGEFRGHARLGPTGALGRLVGFLGRLRGRTGGCSRRGCCRPGWRCGLRRGAGSFRCGSAVTSGVGVSRSNPGRGVASVSPPQARSIAASTSSGPTRRRLVRWNRSSLPIMLTSTAPRLPDALVLYNYGCLIFFSVASNKLGGLTP